MKNNNSSSKLNQRNCPKASLNYTRTTTIQVKRAATILTHEGTARKGIVAMRRDAHIYHDIRNSISHIMMANLILWDGSIDVTIFFCHQCTPKEEKVGLASFYLEGDGQLWSIKLEHD